MINGLLQVGIFLAIFALPCGLFLVSSLFAEELRDFFESTGLSATVHIMSTILVGYLTYSLSRSIFSTEQLYRFGLIIDVAGALIIVSWLLGIYGCLYGELAPHKRISARGLRRYR